MALGRLAETGSSELPWSETEERLANLIAEFGPATRTGRRQSAAYPFTRLRADGVWKLSRDVPMDDVGPLDAAPITGRLESSLETALSRPGQIEQAARLLVDAQFPRTVAPDVLLAVGLDPDQVFAVGTAQTADTEKRRRSSAWPLAILEAWDRQCAFCGYDGQLGSSSVGLEAAHIRWFNLGGPDDLNIHPLLRSDRGCETRLRPPQSTTATPPRNGPSCCRTRHMARPRSLQRPAASCVKVERYQVNPRSRRCGLGGSAQTPCRCGARPSASTASRFGHPCCEPLGRRRGTLHRGPH